jgi:hypothetical protein
MAARPTISRASEARSRRSSFPMPCIFSPNSTFSTTVRCGKSAKCWNTVVVGRFSGGTPSRRSPSRRISPLVGCSCPPIIRRVVVFPQPEGPRRTTYSPCSMVRSMSSTATTLPPKTFVTFRSSRPDPLGGGEGPAAGPSPCRPIASSTIPYAARNSFQRWSWYSFSSSK